MPVVGIHPDGKRGSMPLSEREGVVDLDERRMRVQVESYEEGLQDGRRAGFKEFLDMQTASEKCRHEDRLRMHRALFWLCFVITGALTFLIYAHAMPRLRDFLFTAMGIAFALTIAHLRQWDMHRVEYRHLTRRLKQ